MGELPKSNHIEPITSRTVNADYIKYTADDAGQQDQDLADMDLRSTGLEQTDNIVSSGNTSTDHVDERLDDQKLSGETNTIVPVASDNKIEELTVDNESPRGMNYNTPGKPRDIFLPFGLHQLSQSCFGRGKRISRI